LGGPQKKNLKKGWIFWGFFFLTPPKKWGPIFFSLYGSLGGGKKGGGRGGGHKRGPKQGGAKFFFLVFLGGLLMLGKFWEKRVGQRGGAENKIFQGFFFFFFHFGGNFLLKKKAKKNRFPQNRFVKNQVGI